ncbi:hypothetical protein EON64_13490 [archaeon]|nr:MAG: hypothetical protein EON64_13490 [archaeon]
MYDQQSFTSHLIVFVDAKAQQEASSYPDKPSATARADSQDGADSESVRSSFATQEPPSPARPAGKGGDSAADDLAAWDPFFESAD